MTATRIFNLLCSTSGKPGDDKGSSIKDVYTKGKVEGPSFADTGEGIENPPNFADVFYGRPLR